MARSRWRTYKSSEDPEEVLDSSEPKSVTSENKLDAQSEETTDQAKDSPPEIENVGKENNVEFFKAPKKQLEQLIC